MNVTLSYNDRESFSAEEVVAQARRNYGRNVSVIVTPESSKASDILYFALQSIITSEQLSLFFADKHTYQKELQKLRTDIMYRIQDTMDLVIIDNETKLTKD